MLEVLANRTYRHLFFAQVIALLGTGLATVALGLLAFESGAALTIREHSHPYVIDDEHLRWPS